MEKLHCAALTLLKLFTWGSEIVLNHRLRNVQKLIMISWHLQNRSVTNSLAAELKSVYKLCTVEAIWYDSSLIWIKITIFYHVHEKGLFAVVLNTAAGSVVIWWFGLLHWSVRFLAVTVNNQRWFILYCFCLLSVSLWVNWASCLSLSATVNHKKETEQKWESEREEGRVIMVK